VWIRHHGVIEDCSIKSDGSLRWAENANVRGSILKKGRKGKEGRREERVF
jgi:hypothetical protein